MSKTCYALVGLKITCSSSSSAQEGSAGWSQLLWICCSSDKEAHSSRFHALSLTFQPHTQLWFHHSVMVFYFHLHRKEKVSETMTDYLELCCVRSGIGTSKFGSRLSGMWNKDYSGYSRAPCWIGSFVGDWGSNKLASGSRSNLKLSPAWLGISYRRLLCESLPCLRNSSKCAASVC